MIHLNEIIQAAIFAGCGMIIVYVLFWKINRKNNKKNGR
jgi:hypothetical protein